DQSNGWFDLRNNTHRPGEIEVDAKEVIVNGIGECAREQKDVDSIFISLPIRALLVRLPQLLTKAQDHLLQPREGIEAPFLLQVESRLGASPGPQGPSRTLPCETVQGGKRTF